ncbi:hypothetical protein OSB04_012379, partial [Centaurea solstitialis]
MGESGNTLSKLDRFFVSADFLAAWPSASATVLAREYSNHCPIFLSCIGLDFGPIPFRFFNSWIFHKDFINIVANTWNSCSFRGKVDKALAFKLKAVKKALKNWKIEVIDMERTKREDLKKKVDELDKLAESRQLTTLELEERKAWKKNIRDLDYTKTMDLKQRAHIGGRVTGMKIPDNSMLVAPFSEEEIKCAVWDCGSEKVPGPDGFSFKFYKHCWEIIKGDVISLVRQFEKDGKFSEGCNSLFISLFPKKNDALSLRDYRLISLIDLLLMERLKKVVGKIVSMEQSAYVEGRQILDGPLMVNEVCGWAKRAKKRILLFKVDFEKAFDSISWSYLDSILEQMYFCPKWRSWIKACLKSARASVLVNGSPTREFPLSRGLRQRDTLSPFLFIIAMEGLHIAMREATNKNLFHGISLPNNGPLVSYLLFADDVMFLGKWSAFNAINLKRILNCFHHASGLKVNFSKSKVYALESKRMKLVTWHPYLIVTLQNYLLTTLASLLVPTWDWQRIGKLFLIRFRRNYLCGKPKLSLLEEELLCANLFIWGISSSGNQKICWVDWLKTTAPKHLGGLGIGSLKSANIALLIKWIWRFKNNDNALWTNVIKATHGLSGGDPNVLAKTRYACTWLNIVKAGSALSSLNLNIEDFFTRKVRNGIDTKFCDKLCSIESRFLNSNNGVATWRWSWINTTVVERHADKVEELENLLKHVVLQDGVDKWSWDGDPSGEYTVSSLRGIIDSLSNPSGETLCFWNNWMPPRVNCFVWRLLLNRIPTRTNLSKRGINTPSISCPLCNLEEESVDHLFCTCSMVKNLWRWFFNWCLIDIGQPDSLNQMLFKVLEFGKSIKWRNFLETTVGGLVWFIWKARNNAVFKGVRFSASMVKDDFQATLFSWMKFRAK